MSIRVSVRARLWTVPVAAALLAGCATPQAAAPGAGGGDPAPTASPSPAASPTTRTAALIAGWRAGPGQQVWRTGFVPLQGLSVPPAGARFTRESRVAFDNGWYTLAFSMPREVPGRRGTITFHDGGTMEVPVQLGVEAYRELASGQPPACRTYDKARLPERTPAAPPCRPLTVTGARYGTVDLRTSRGTAAVPAWFFTVPELGGDVARVAVDPASITTVPNVPAEDPPAALMSVDRILAAEGGRVTFTANGSVCDRNIKPSVTEAEDVVVLGATATRGTGGCTRQLAAHAVVATLRAPLGDRPVLDAHSGRLLTPGRRSG
ncbi:hypothetical protein GCM10010123_39840 [Pilimelia anulata]|uniref:Uncharacterized protein n=1 Tax=Pilimelia anulata TaxID=53371 RepID=A0A8J3FFQ2_9ACTN|nr:hypothetical protein [Pilimelia anulata]GGK05918.1 hypothetical protein GCM10010123_39840 [Pilimelia anulata]